MQLTLDQVRKIALLARLQLSDAELEKFAAQLSDVLTYSSKLDEVDTEGVQPMAQITGIQDVFFEDEVKKCDFTAQLLAQSPQPMEGNMIKVKRVL